MKLPLSILAVSIVISVSAGIAHGGMSYVSQERLVSAGFLESGIAEAQHAQNFGTFDGHMAATYDTDFNSKSRSAASQHSTLGVDQIAATGSVLAVTNEGSPMYRSFIDVTFDLSAATRYDLRGDVSGIDTAGLAHTYSISDLIAVRLQQLTPGTQRTLLEYRANDAEIDNFVRSPVFEASGDLPAGRYRVTFEAQAGITSGVLSGDYSFHLRTGPAVTAVPVPPAVWGGLATLSGVGFIAWTRRRRTAWGI